MQTEISAPGAAVAPAGRPLISADDRKVLAATLVGSTIEWYDYFIYSQAAGLVLARCSSPLHPEQSGMGADPVLRHGGRGLPVPAARRHHLRTPG